MNCPNCDSPCHDVQVRYLKKIGYDYSQCPKCKWDNSAEQQKQALPTFSIELLKPVDMTIEIEGKTYYLVEEDGGFRRPEPFDKVWVDKESSVKWIRIEDPNP